MDRNTLLEITKKGDRVLIRFFELTGSVNLVSFGAAVSEWGWTDIECKQVADYLVQEGFITQQTFGKIRDRRFKLEKPGQERAKRLILDEPMKNDAAATSQSGGIKFGLINSTGDVNINLSHVAGRDQITTTTSTTITQQGSSSSAAATPLPPIINKVELSKLIRQHYDLGEFKSLCFELEVAYDDLPGETLTNRVEALVEYLERRGRVPHLLPLLKQQRPSATWPDTLSD